jgi:protease II
MQWLNEREEVMLSKTKTNILLLLLNVIVIISWPFLQSPKNPFTKLFDFIQTKKPGSTVEIPASMNGYRSFSDAWRPVISADGKHMCMNWNITNESQVWCMNGPGMALKQLTSGDIHEVKAITSDGFVIVYRVQKTTHSSGLYYIPVRGGNLSVLKHAKEGQTVFEYLGDDGKIYYRSNYKHSTRYTSYVFDLATRQSVEIFDEPGIWKIRDQKGHYVLLEKSKGESQKEYWRLDTRDKTMVPVLGQNENEDYSVSFGAKDGEYIVLTNKNSEFRRLYRWSNARELTPITGQNLAVDISFFAIDSGRQRILYEINDKGYRKVLGMDAGTFQPIAMPNFKDGAIDSILLSSHSYGGNFTIFSVDRYNKPPEKYVYEWRTGVLQNWHEINPPMVDSSSFVQAKLQYCPSRDGKVQIPMFVWVPKICNNALCPIIVSFHGGPEEQADPGWDLQAQMFVNNGYIYFRPNIRGSDGYGRTWLNSDNGPKRLSVITDVADVGICARKKYTYKNQEPKVGVTGESYGGYATYLAMTKFSGTYDAGVATSGMVNLESFLDPSVAGERIITLRSPEYGNLKEHRTELRALSPINSWDKLKAPLLIVHGVLDPIVPAAQIDEIRGLPNTEKYVTVLLLENEHHQILNQDNRLFYWGTMIDFFDKHLKN